MDPEAQAFPQVIADDTVQSTSGISYRQWMIGKVASGYLANPSVDLEEVRCNGHRKDEVVTEIIAITDELIGEEEEQ